MPRVTYVHPNGEREELDVAVGMSLMQGATSHGIDGILAGVRGQCHVRNATGSARSSRTTTSTSAVSRAP